MIHRASVVRQSDYPKYSLYNLMDAVAAERHMIKCTNPINIITFTSTFPCAISKKTTLAKTRTKLRVQRDAVQPHVTQPSHRDTVCFP